MGTLLMNVHTIILHAMGMEDAVRKVGFSVVTVHFDKCRIFPTIYAVK